ncbi:MAG: DUF2905 domain-containing protein [Deltaproteobacteria bacterium]|nr:DUF2905 domain-containing protein [Deltaproteobacteria bacterium]
MPSLSKIFIYLGLFFLLIGIFLWVRPEIAVLKNLGNLPGDFIIIIDGASLYFPVVSSLLISLIFTLLHYLFSWLKK